MRNESRRIRSQRRLQQPLARVCQSGRTDRDCVAVECQRCFDKRDDAGFLQRTRGGTIQSGKPASCSTRRDARSALRASLLLGSVRGAGGLAVKQQGLWPLVFGLWSLVSGLNSTFVSSAFRLTPPLF